ncbi:hypothetical protein OG21DRAFT_1490546 [Imleria badia]|nr:hypothetical protein OG21DRAFT_1490546 [Imleria badia]
MTVEGETNPQVSKRLAEKQETHIQEVQEMASATERKTEDTPHTNVEEEPTVFESAGTSQVPLVQYGDQPKFLDAVRKGYKSESLLVKIVAQPSHYPQFTEKDSLLYMKICGNEEVLCLPQVKFKGDSLIAQIIDGTHKALGHFGAQRTADYIRRKYWWPKLSQEVDKF